jgi:rhodanese-related sulfurtransferase
MRKLILITFLAAAAALAQNGTPAKAKTLTRAELDQLLATPDKVLLIDVRRPDELTSIGGFPVYLSIQAKDLENHLDAIPKDRILVTVSNHAARAGKAADLLASKGFNVAGAVGAETYEKEGGTLTKIEPPKKAATAEKQ